MDTGTEQLCAAFLAEQTGIETEVLQSVDSTNAEAKRRVRAGLRSPLLLLAEEQTAGRGRQGKSFFSPRGTGLYLTLVLHPHIPVREALSVTARASVAVCRAIRALTPEEPGIKWVNDVYLRGRKICGILVEAVSDFSVMRTESLLIGIGLNLTTEDFPPELPDAASLGGGVGRNAMAAAIVRELLRETEEFSSDAYLEAYRAWSIVLGREIRFTRNGVTRSGRAIQIDGSGALSVLLPDGQTELLQSGEISLRVSEGSASVSETGQ